MKTFFNILQTITNTKHKTYPDEPFKMHEQSGSNIYTNEMYHINFFINTIFGKEKKSEYSDKNKRISEAKLKSLNSILEDTFCTNELKEQIFNIFSKSQKCYFAFSHLARIYKTKKYPIVVSHDLTLNSLDINHTNTFTLIENKSIFLFSLNDIISIIEMAISNSPNFFSDPLPTLNPYTKIQLTNSTLYNIYFKLKESRRLMSTLFHLFFLENFNPKEFSEKNEPMIREYSIKTYVYNSPYTTLHSSVLSMLKNNPFTKKYVIHKDFPKNTLVEIFRPYLFYYFIVNYYIENTTKIYNFNQILYTKLKQFYKYNTTFGRQYVQLTKTSGKIVKKEYKYNTKHIKYNQNSADEEHVTSEHVATLNVVTNNMVDSSDEELIHGQYYVYTHNTNTLIGELWNNTIIQLNEDIHSMYDPDSNEDDGSIS